jgi:hypothetical protein
MTGLVAIAPLLLTVRLQEVVAIVIVLAAVLYLVRSVVRWWRSVALPEARRPASPGCGGCRCCAGASRAQGRLGES